MARTLPYRIFIYDTNGKLVSIPVDILSGSFEDVVNGGSGAGQFSLPRRFVDVGEVNYEYRVQFYLADSVDPWYDGRIVDFDQEQMENKDSETIIVYTDGWRTRMSYAITSDHVDPGVQPNGQILPLTNADTFLAAEIASKLDSATFGTSYLSSIPVALDKLTFDGTELDKAIEDIVKQVDDNTGNTYEWWVRGKTGGKPQLVIQPNANPNKVTTTYRTPPTYTGTTPSAQVKCGYNYEWKNGTIQGYKQTNSGRQIYNMVAAYGGPDPMTKINVYGAFKHSLSISLYGLRQKKITNSVVTSQKSLSMYAAVYLLLNAFPQPQTTFKKVAPSDVDRAGVWYQIMEPSIGVLTQNIKQERCIKVHIDFGADSLVATMTCTAPRPFIDNAYYAAIGQASRAQTFRVTSTNLTTYFIAAGFNWIRSGSINGQPTVDISPPSACFNSLTPVSMPGGPNADFSYTVALVDSVITGSSGTGDGRYEVLYALDPLTDFSVMSHAPGFVVVKGSPSPYNPNVMHGWSFMVINGAISGSQDLRIYGGINAANINFGNHPFPVLAAPVTLISGFTDNSIHAQVDVPQMTITNCTVDNTVSGVYFQYRLHGAVNDSAMKPLDGMPFVDTKSAIQNIGPFGFEVGAGQLIDVFMGFAGMSSKDYGPAIQLGSAAQIANGFLPQPLVVTSAYLAGTSLAPVVSSSSLAVATSVSPGLSSAINLAFTITNQPTDNSLGKIVIYYRVYNATTPNPWSFYARINPTANGIYPDPATPGLQLVDLTNGVTYEAGVSFEATNLREAGITSIGTRAAQPATAGGSGSPMPAAILSAGPSLSNSFLSGVQRGGSGVALQDLSFTLADFTTPPTWLSAVVLTLRDHGTGTGMGLPEILPLPATNYYTGATSPTIAIPAGKTADVGVYYIDQTGASSATAWPAGFANIIALQIGVSYFKQGATAAPNVTNVSYGFTDSQNGISGSVRLYFTINNQPTDNSLSRIAIYRRKTNSGTTPYEKLADFPAIGLPTPAGVQAYIYDSFDLTNGVSYDWACAFEDAQGGEAPQVPTNGVENRFAGIANGYITTTPAAQVVIGNQQSAGMPYSILVNGPTYNGGGVGAQRGGSAATAQDLYFNLSDYTGAIPNWLDGLYMIERKANTQEPMGTPNRITPVPAVSSSPPYQYNVTASIPAGSVVDIGFYYVDKLGISSKVTWSASFLNIASQGITSGAGAAMPAALLASGPVTAVYDTLSRILLAGSQQSITLRITLNDFGTPIPGWLNRIVVTAGNSDYTGSGNGYYSTVDAGGSTSPISSTSTSITFTISIPAFSGDNVKLGVYYIDRAGNSSAIAVLFSNYNDPIGVSTVKRTGHLRYILSETGELTSVTFPNLTLVTSGPFAGAYRLDSPYAQASFGSATNTGLIIGQWYTFDATVCLPSSSNGITTSIGLFDVANSGPQLQIYSGSSELDYSYNGGITVGPSGAVSLNDGRWHRLTLKVCYIGNGNVRQVAYIDNVAVYDTVYAYPYLGPMLPRFMSNAASGQMYIHPGWTYSLHGEPPIMSSTTLNKQGSMLNISGMPLVGYSTGPNDAALTIPATTIKFTDNQTTLYVPAASPSASGLASNSAYYINLSISIAPYQAGGTVGQYATFISAANTPIPPDVTLAQCYMDGFIPVFSNFAITTTTAGGGRSALGYRSTNIGITSCPAEYQLVKTLEAGFIRADQVDIGMHLPSGDALTWVRVNDATRMPTELWRYEITNGTTYESFDVNSTHASKDINGEWLQACNMKSGDKLLGVRENLVVVSAKSIGQGHYIGFDVEGHEYSMGQDCVHNAVTI